MKKNEFLNKLRESLSILQESEIQDVLDEYGQHIDLKTANGMTEEEAVADFGDVSELSNSILEAYHINAQVAQAELAQEESLGDKAKGILSGVGDKARNLKENLSEKAEAHAEKRAEKKAAREQDAIDHPKEPRQPREPKEHPAAKKVAGGVKKGAVATGHGIAGFCWWIVFLIVACIMLCVACCAVACIIAMGISLVMAIQGLPLIGVTLCLLGTSMLFVVITLLIVRTMRNRYAKRKERVHA